MFFGLFAARSALRPSSVSRSPRSKRRCKIGVEPLEDRTVPSVLTPAQVRHAYGFDQIAFNVNGQTIPGDGRGQTIAIVDAYDDPNVLADLKHFDATFGLPDPAFTKATPQGTPAMDSGWAMEIALDVEWAHAIAPRASILLVEAKTSGLGDLLNAVDYARRQSGVVAVSMSWGAGEFSGETYFDSYFTTPGGHPGVTFVASSGDSGARYGPSWPAVSSNVLSVGGTHLNIANSAGAYYSESGWSYSGGGYSAYVSRPAFQNGFFTNSHRGNPDVAYDADPNSGFYVYDTAGASGWYDVGGTSAGSPQWAALVAIADEGRMLFGRPSLDGPTQTLYTLYKMAATSWSTYYHDIATGYNGYSSHTGYDLVTGLGTPKAALVVGGLTNTSGAGTAIAFSPGTTGGGAPINPKIRLIRHATVFVDFTTALAGFALRLDVVNAAPNYSHIAVTSTLLAPAAPAVTITTPARASVSQPVHLTAPFSDAGLSGATNSDDDSDLPFWWPADVLPMPRGLPLMFSSGPLPGWFGEGALPVFPPRRAAAVATSPASGRAESTSAIAVTVPAPALAQSAHAKLTAVNDARPAAAVAVIAVAGAMALVTRREAMASGTAFDRQRPFTDREDLPAMY